MEFPPSLGAQARVKELRSLTSSDTGGHQAVDVKLSASPLDVMLVNTQGAVYKCDASSKTRLVRPTSDSAPDAFWRLELTASADTCLLLSKTDLKELDFRTPASSLAIYTSTPTSVLTSLEDYPPDALLRLCTTTQIIWLDRRFAAKPVLAFKHGRAFDRSLEARTIRTDDGHLTTLTSRRNGLLTVYDVARSHTAFVHAAPPYCLTVSSSPRARGGGVPNQNHKGHAFLRHPLEGPDAPMGFYRLTEVGSISAFRLSSGGGAEEASCVWGEDVRRLAAQAGGLREESSSLSLGEMEERTVVDMGPAYEHFFRERSDVEAEEAAESLYDLVEKAPSYWQDLNEPVDGVLTTYDVLLRSSDDPSAASTRADFLTDSVINSSRGYRAVVQKRVSAAALGAGAPWSRDIRHVLRNFDRDFEEEDVRAVAEGLRRFDLGGASARRESEAREQVALDLALAGHVYSPRAFLTGPSRDVEKDGELETMTQTLSLEDEPGPVWFGYLRPRRQDEDDEEMVPAGCDCC
ncbi:hypothetical protein B0H12DRAFT_180043 [Mycena haematopus]|nr:hypothetical protein B0H12DRAFT_180043 [Mycena haematopus]